MQGGLLLSHGPFGGFNKPQRTHSVYPANGTAKVRGPPPSVGAPPHRYGGAGWGKLTIWGSVLSMLFRMISKLSMSTCSSRPLQGLYDHHPFATYSAYLMWAV